MMNDKFMIEEKLCMRCMKYHGENEHCVEMPKGTRLHTKTVMTRELYYNPDARSMAISDMCDSVAREIVDKKLETPHMLNDLYSVEMILNLIVMTPDQYRHAVESDVEKIVSYKLKNMEAMRTLDKLEAGEADKPT